MAHQFTILRLAICKRASRRREGNPRKVNVITLCCSFAKLMPCKWLSIFKFFGPMFPALFKLHGLSERRLIIPAEYFHSNILLNVCWFNKRITMFVLSNRAHAIRFSCQIDWLTECLSLSSFYGTYNNRVETKLYTYGWFKVRSFNQGLPARLSRYCSPPIYYAGIESDYVNIS